METENSEGSSLLRDSMEDMSALDLNEKIISLPSFSCKKCQKLLRPPIMLVVGISNVCGPCNVADNKHVLHNPALESILQNLLIPCRNSLRGCMQTVDYFNMSAHEAVCAKRNYVCPLKLFEGCTWEGNSSVLLAHSMAGHSGFVIGGDGYSFKIDVDISITSDVVKLLYTDTEKFILHIRCDTKARKLHYVMYYVKGADKPKEYSYTVEQTGCIGSSSRLLHSISNKFMLNDTELTRDFDVNHALNLNLKPVKQLVKEPVIPSVIRIFPKNCQVILLDQRLLHFFECPNCNHFMKSPIYQCLTGHSICSSCRPRLNKCPTCKTNFGSTRNYTLEALSNDVQFPCCFRDHGCHITMLAADITKHETECPLRPYHCPLYEFEHCSWKGINSALGTHLKADHSTKVTSNYKMNGKIQYEDCCINLHFLIIYGQVFRVSCKRNATTRVTCWTVQFVGPRGQCTKYKYEIGWINHYNPHRKFIRTEQCQELTTADNMFNQCIMFPTNMVNWFPHKGAINYYCKISKVTGV